jgi:hypothetical protein
VALALAGCGEDFQERSQLRDLRVLALVAEPLEVGPGEAVTIRPVVHVPPGAAVATQSWSFCPFTAGATASYACAVPECEVPVAAGEGGAVTADPLALASECLARLAGGAPPPGIPAELPDRVETVFRYRVEAGGDAREAIARIPFHPRGAPAERNAPPVLAGVEIAGAPAGSTPPVPPGAKVGVRVRLEAASAQRYVDASGRAVTESLVVSFFSTAGEWDADRADGPDARRELELKDLGDAAAVTVWVVARDLRGGEAVAGPFTIPIERARGSARSTRAPSRR